MKVLAIDTSSSCGAVGICDGEKPLAEMSLVSRETYAARLLPSIDWLLQTAGLTLAQIDGFGVTLGPGSFTGLRVGLATVKGFAWVAGKPVAGLHSLEVLARQIPETGSLIAPMLDARREHVFGAVYRWNGDRLETVVPASDYEAAALLSPFREPVVCLGEGARRFENEIKSLGENFRLAPADFDLPRGATLSLMAHRALTEGNVIDIRSAEPLYLRPSAPESNERKATSP